MEYLKYQVALRCCFQVTWSRTCMKILIVDDHAFQRKALSSMVDQVGSHKIIEASDGNEAISQMVQGLPDIIICDLIMPNVDGLALLRWLAEQKFTGGIIVSSASNASILRSADHLVNFLGLNLLAVIPKPCSTTQLKHFFSKYEQNKPVKFIESAPLIDVNKEALLKALNNGEFTNVYQPQIDFNTGECVGLEALTRWQHPDLGILLPTIFIEQIEDMGLMVQLTIALIDQSIKDLKQLPPSFHHTKLSINLTPSCLTCETIEKILSNQPLMALAHQGRISFEITEQTQILNDCLSLELLSRLCINGFNLSIDDFGTGYSSLKQLSKYPFNEIKLDPSFVEDALIDVQSSAIVDMSIQLAKRLQMNVVVEGVESHEQWVYLKRLGAQTCQGYFCAKPMKYQELTVWLPQWEEKYKAMALQLKRNVYV